jgi:hypothetical protein
MINHVASMLAATWLQTCGMMKFNPSRQAALPNSNDNQVLKESLYPLCSFGEDQIGVVWYRFN